MKLTKLLLLSIIFCLVFVSCEMESEVVPNPTITPDSGTYYNPVTVTITDSDSTAIIKYTKDNSPVRNSSAIYTKSFEISTDTVIRAKAFKSGKFDSEEIVKEYKFRTATPSYVSSTYREDGSVDSAQISLVSETREAVIHYTTDRSTPNEDSPVFSELKPINILEDTVIKAIAVSKFGTSAVFEKKFYIKGAPISQKTPAPQFGHNEKYFVTSLDITILCDNPSATIYYTIDGSEPTLESTKYSTPIHLTETCTIKAISFYAGYRTSDVVTFDVNKLAKVATPTVNLASGEYVGDKTIIFSCDTKDAKIRYTTDGTDPTDSKTAKEIDADTILRTEGNVDFRFIAVKNDYANSDEVERSYKIKLQTPTSSVQGGTYYNDVQLKLECETEGATIYYSTDNSSPIDGNIKKYTGSINIKDGMIIKAYANKSGYKASDVMEAQTYYLKVSTPTITPNKGFYDASYDCKVSIESETEDINPYEIHWTRL
ncbi:MAG: chitobiase/beta-hexosaminidase C-terminal domain-containing protein [Sphaerochaetaceae bacterium]|nr:chitobiase/beta-hexosaminidase C-terminal domain-containing protein [Sphaerochaetaceae bacterium]